MSPSERKITILQLRHILRSVLNGEACLVCLDKRFVLNVNREQRPSRNAVKKIKEIRIFNVIRRLQSPH